MHPAVSGAARPKGYNENQNRNMRCHCAPNILRNKMLNDPSRKYRAFPQIDLPDRQWPSRTIDKAPRWLSTDLRDGNQALIDPMGAEKKNRFFDLLVMPGTNHGAAETPYASRRRMDFFVRHLLGVEPRR